MIINITPFKIVFNTNGEPSRVEKIKDIKSRVKKKSTTKKSNVKKNTKKSKKKKTK